MSDQILPDVRVKEPSKINNTKIKVIGVGGGGGNAITHMAKENVFGVNYLAVNTDLQALNNIHEYVKNILQIGNDGLGAGTDPNIGEEAARSSRSEIENFLEDTDMVFITAGMGGGTGTGAAPVVAEIAREMGVLTIGIVTKPFEIEGRARHKAAIEGITKLKEHVDSIIIIPNEKLYEVLGEDTTLVEAFASVNNVLLNAVQGIAEIITTTGLVNTDFADVKKIMKNGGLSMMGSGLAEGEMRAESATEAAIRSPLLEDASLDTAKSVLVNITSSDDITMAEYKTIGNIIQTLCEDDAIIVIGTITDPNYAGQIKVNVIATGLSKEEVLNENKKVNNFNMTLNNNKQKESTQKLNSNSILKTKAVTSNSSSSDQNCRSKSKEKEKDLKLPSFLLKKNK